MSSLRRISIRCAGLRRAVALACLLACAGHAARAADDNRATRYYEDALTRYENRDIAGAIIQLKNALQVDRNLLPVQVLLGKALLRNGEAVAAEVALNEALRLGVNRAEIAVTLAQALVAQGKQRQVVEQPLFNPAGLPPGVQVPLLLQRSAAFADLGNAAGALQAIDEARALQGNTPEVWLAEVPVRLRARQFREASAAADRALALAPQSAEALYQKGSTQHVLGDLRAALASYDQALAKDATHVEARVARAGIFVDAARPAEAAKDIAELQRVSPKEPRAAYLKAVLAEHDNNGVAARSALADVTRLLDPVPIEFIRYRPQLLMLAGLAHYGLNEREKAKPYLEGFQRAQGNTAVSKLLAQIYLDERNSARAIEVLETYLKGQPGDVQAVAMLASAHMAEGRYAKAMALTQSALQTQDAPELRTVLGLSLLKAGRPAHAIPELEAALQKNPNQMEAGTTLVGLYLQNRQPKQAVALADSLVKRQPGNAGLAGLLGAARAQAGDNAGARKAFERALQLDANNTAATLSLARLDSAGQNFDAAAARLAALIKTNERDVDALLEMARLSERRGQAADSLRWLQKANDAAGPSELRPGLTLVSLHLRDGRIPPALEAAKAVLAKAPDNVPALLAYSRAHMVGGDLASARNSLTNASRLADYSAPTLLEISLLQADAKDLGGATYSLEKALSAAPDYLPALGLLAEVDLRRGDSAAADRRARQLIEKNPKRAIGHSLLGDVARARGQNAAATDAYRRAHQVEPSSDTLLRLFASLSQQDPKAGLALADGWLKAQPLNHTVRKALADGQARSGDFAGARANYERVVKAAPSDTEALNNLANVLLRLNDPSAVPVAEQAVAKSPANAYAIDTLGWALFRAGQAERALPLLRDARLRDPGNPEIRYHLGALLLQTGRKGEAREELQAALQGGRPFEQAGEVRRLLQSTP